MFKAMIVILCGILFGAVLKPPQPVAKKTIVFYRGQPLEYIVRGLCYFGVSVLSLAFACFATTIVAFSGLPAAQNVVPYVCPTERFVSGVLQAYSPRFVAGASLVIAGALLRLWAFRTLGTLFTFEVVITPEHRLVTSGPYAFVRHPSYTGLIMLLFGVHLVHFGVGGYITACNIVATPAGVLVYVWRACLIFVPAPETVFRGGQAALLALRRRVAPVQGRCPVSVVTVRVLGVLLYLFGADADTLSTSHLLDCTPK